MVQVAIIGANSYIARNLIYCMNRENIGLLTLYDIQNQFADEFSSYKSIDFMSDESLQGINWDADVIYFFTGKTGTEQGFEDYSSYIDINEIFLLRFLQKYIKNKCKARVIFPSTRLVYKGNEDSTLKEDAEKEFKTVYALNKYSCERYLEMYENRYHLNYTILRICIPYGSLVGDCKSYGTIGFFLQKAQQKNNICVYGDGLQRRTFTHIKDLCNVMMKAAANPQCQNDVFNIGGESMSLLDVASQIAKKYNVSVVHAPWPEVIYRLESGSTVFDSNKLDTVLQNNYPHSFSEWVKLL
ncbi:MAG: NAD(P)-dependent oxidoreductase [Hydrogenoanaerobacterium sp.]